MCIQMLGSLCSSLCDKCSLTCEGCCSKTTIIIGYLKDDMDIFKGAQDARNNLYSGLQQINSYCNSEKLISYRAMKVSRNQLDRYEEVSSLGILELTRKYASKLAIGAERNEAEEGFQRLMKACDRCGINIAQKYTYRTPLCQIEKKRLKKAVQLISEYGSRAAYIWRQMKSYNISSSAELARHVWSSKKVERFFDKVEDSFFRGVREKEKFCDLSADEANIFLDAAHLVSKKCICAFVSWIDKVNFEESAKVLHRDYIRSFDDSSLEKKEAI